MDQNNKCNLRCRMCGFSDPRMMKIKKYDMPLWLLRMIAEQVFPRAKYVAFSCLTEPLMTGDFSKRVSILEHFPVPFSEVITNGMLLNDEVINALIDVPVTRLGVSLDGANKKTYELIRRGANFDRVVDNIRRFNELKEKKRTDYPHLRVLHVLSEANIDEFEDFLGMAKSLNAQAVDVRTISPFRNAADRGTSADRFWERVKENEKLLESWTKRWSVVDTGYLRVSPKEVVILDDKGHRVMCRRPWDTFAVHANGDVVPCMSWARSPMGNIARESFEQIWKGKIFENVREEFNQKRPGPDCQYCSVRKSDLPNEEDDFYFRMLNKKPPEREGCTIC